MMAGQFAYEIVDDEEGRQDTIRSRTDWCMAYDAGKDESGNAEVAAKKMKVETPAR